MQRTKIEISAAKLDETLRPFPWYSAVGVGELDGNAVIFVYVKKAVDDDKTKVPDTWQGYNILLRIIGDVVM